MASFEFPMAGMSFTAAISKLILVDQDERETGSDRLKQIAFLTIIFQMQIAQTRTTYSNLVKVIGLPRTSMADLAPRLIQKGLLEERRVLNSRGKGHSNELVIPQSLIDALLPNLRLL